MNTVKIVFVGFWWWCISIEWIVFLDFIHRLVSQEQTPIPEDQASVK